MVGDYCKRNRYFQIRTKEELKKGVFSFVDGVLLLRPRKKMEVTGYVAVRADIYGEYLMTGKHWVDNSTFSPTPGGAEVLGEREDRVCGPAYAKAHPVVGIVPAKLVVGE